MSYERILKFVFTMSNSKNGLNILQKHFGGPNTIQRAIEIISKNCGVKK